MLFVVLPSVLLVTGLLLWRAKSGRWVAQVATDGSSIGIAVVGRNEQQTVGLCLESVLAQTHLFPKVVRFIDDDSSDRTKEIAEQLAVANQCLEVSANPVDRGLCHSPKKEALAFAFSRIDTQWIAVTDADCAVPADWLSSLIANSDDSCGAVLGASWPPTGVPETYRWERLIANISMASACGWGFPASACGHSILYRRQAIEDVGAPVRRDLPSGDDDLTVQAIARTGWRVVFCDSPESVVTDHGARGSRLSQAARHQSVTRFYPIRWRLLFAWTSLVGVLSYPLLLSPLIFPSCSILAAATIVKVALDTAAGVWFSRRMKLDITPPGVLAGSLFLPIWLVWRVFAHVFRGRYIWRGRQFESARNLNTVTKAS
ncbi:MAG: glycosyltransferase [Calditrichaeota bacterium]|nr:glycosyltransferase [Calditrichota bacterium]MCB9366465.1 glycosyltransferase [Calditrichota bacterium]MCB9391277.1 glycosyltransferase [Calditrichota bacterium]